MAIVKDWFCLAHGDFSNTTGKCPHKCSKRFVEQRILSPPAFRSSGTKNIDHNIRDLAQSHGLSDIPSVKEGESVMEQLKRKDPKKQPREFRAQWGAIDVPHAQPGWSERGEEAPKFVSGMAPGVNINELKPTLKPLSQMTRIVGSVPKPPELE